MAEAQSTADAAVETRVDVRGLAEPVLSLAGQARFTVVAPASLTELHAAEAPQKDHLCGAFWGSLALRAAGFASFGDDRIDQDLVARESQSTLDEGDPYQSLPPGARPRTDYRLELPLEDPTHSGTAAPPLRTAISRCSDHRLNAVPVAGPWTAESVVMLLRVAHRHDPGALLIGNPMTRFLWKAQTPPEALASYLGGMDPQSPGPDWDVGHFVSIVCAIERDQRALIGILDTYPALGERGFYLQPAVAVAASLERPEAGEGGVLCVTSSQIAPALESDLVGTGFELRDWDNGTRFTPGPT